LKRKVFLAGRVAVESDGVLIDEQRFPGRQGRLLFAYLVAEQGRPVPRDELADALWGEAPPATSDKALTVLASKLRGPARRPRYRRWEGSHQRVRLLPPEPAGRDLGRHHRRG
jgi:DNA-binding SARP family transcriptional activator